MSEVSLCEGTSEPTRELQTLAPLSVLVADRSRAFAEALAGLLNASEGVAADYAHMHEVDAEHECSVVVLDGDHPTTVLSAVAATLRKRRPDVRIVLLTKAVGPEQRRAVSELGAAGCVSRQIRPPALARALREAHAHGQVRALAPVARRRLQGDDLLVDQLTCREIEVLRLLALGRRTEQVADTLGISANTVRTHIQNLTAKLGVRSRLAAVALARRVGLLQTAGDMPGGQ